MPERLTVTPTTNGGWRFDGFVDYSAVLKDAGPPHRPPPAAGRPVRVSVSGLWAYVVLWP